MMSLFSIARACSAQRDSGGICPRSRWLRISAAGVGSDSGSGTTGIASA